MVNKQEIEERTLALARKLIEDADLRVLAVHLDREGDETYLRVFLESDRGVSIDDCVMMSGRLGTELDASDVIDSSYILQVSSSGEMPLRNDIEFQNAISKYVEISTHRPVDGLKRIRGTLRGIGQDEAVIEADDGREYHIPRSSIAASRMAIR